MVGTVVFGMCTKNEEAVVRETMRAIRTQTHPPDYIYICDASDDATPDVVRDELAKSDIPFEVFEQERYDGHGGARQELYERAREVDPDVLCMLDANNTVDEDWLANIVDFWEGHPEYDALTGPDCSEEVHHECGSPHDPLYYRHAAIALDTDLIEAVGGWDPDFGRGEDWDFALRMHRADADVFTSSRWCSRYLTSDPSGLARKRIAGNPTSVPYLSKYGRWYATFHPAQLLKDAGSVLFYLLVGVAAVTAALAPQYGALLAGLAALYAVGYVFGSVLYTEEVESSGFKRALYLLLYTAPAVLRSTRDVLRGRYQNTP